MDEDRYERGRERFLEVHDEKALAAVEGLGALGRAIVEFAYGDVYRRPGLSLRDREIAAVAALVATGRSSQLPQHLRASLKAGLTVSGKYGPTVEFSASARSSCTSRNRARPR